MALALNNGVLYDNDEPWFDYYILNIELSLVFRIFKNEEGEIDREISGDIEVNPYLTDLSTGLDYFLAVYDSNLFLDPVKKMCTMQSICDSLEITTSHLIEVSTKLDRIEQVEEEQTSEIITLNNGWKAIT